MKTENGIVIEVRDLVKQYTDVTAVDGVSFEIREGEIFGMVGPNGAGKTTTLRVISGLTKQDRGSVLFDGEPVDEVTPADRDTAFVFQQYSLYPAMTVYENLAFPLRSPMRKMPEDQIKIRASETAEILRISHLLDRKTENLSGGEMQRVSLGRALDGAPDAAAGTMDHFGFIVDSKEELQAWFDYMKEVGADLLDKPHDHSDGARSFHVRDPAGNVVQPLYHPAVSGQKFSGGQ